MQTTPNHERPLRAVPQTPEQHRGDEIGVGAQSPATIPTERDVQVVTQPRGKRDVPAPPKIYDVVRLIGRGKVRREAHPQERRGTDGNVRVAREIRVNL